MAEEVKPDWLTEMDEEILEILSTNLILSPSIIAENIDRSREGVSNRLNSLQAGGLVEKVDRGKYKITYDGLAVYMGKDEADRFDWYTPESLGWDEEDVERAEKIAEEIGISKKEFQSLVRRKYSKIIKEEPEIDEPLREAEKRAEKVLSEHYSS